MSMPGAQIHGTGMAEGPHHSQCMREMWEKVRLLGTKAQWLGILVKQAEEKRRQPGKESKKLDATG
jgi:hypothetical protein